MKINPVTVTVSRHHLMQLLAVAEKYAGKLVEGTPGQRATQNAIWALEAAMKEKIERPE